MKKFIYTFAACAVMMAVTPGAAFAQAKKFVVGYANLADTDVFTMSRKTAFIDAVKADANVSVSFADANGDISKQLDQIDNFIAQKVNALVIVPVDYQGIVPGVEKANKAGIPVIALGIESAGGKYTFVGSKNLDAGRMQGEFMKDKLPKGAQILYLQGQPGLSHSKERLDGFTKAMASRTDVKVLANLPANYDRAEGMKITEDWVQRFPKFDAIIAANDQMALGALQALKTAGRKGVLISGIDGTADALNAIKSGDMAQSIFQNAKGQALGAFEVVQMIEKGQPLPKEKLVPFESIVKENVNNYTK
ncbi:inositol transport system substrate-binding protein [Rhodoferax ferrireducens]|uniref:Inositol transport system substrate-binding protein n=1 Tax=Rhodoferax ferrireducens TaxID=192843 RepID=A0ABU2CBW8_9BURK|nr:sugar ABC transporter substrate-binding protein [Rhodoferax ferrireducens]MDR7378837.1 inositol transport system substrate-binding protein [Rhodoferax ferrireducens]